MSCKFFHPIGLYNQCMHKDQYLFGDKEPEGTFETRPAIAQELQHFEYFHHAIPEAGTKILGYEIVTDFTDLEHYDNEYASQIEKIGYRNLGEMPNLTIDENGLIHGYIDILNNQPQAVPYATPNNVPLLGGENWFNNGRPKKYLVLKFVVRVNWVEIARDPNNLTEPYEEQIPCRYADDYSVYGSTEKLCTVVVGKLQDIDNWIFLTKMTGNNFGNLFTFKYQDITNQPIRGIPTINPLAYDGEDIYEEPFDEDIERARNLKIEYTIPEVEINPLVELNTEQKQEYLASLHPDLREAIKYAIKLSGKNGIKGYLTLKEIEIVNNLLQGDGCLDQKDRIKNALGLAVKPGCCSIRDILKEDE